MGLLTIIISQMHIIPRAIINFGLWPLFRPPSSERPIMPIVSVMEVRWLEKLLVLYPPFLIQSFMYRYPTNFSTHNKVDKSNVTRSLITLY